MRLFVMMLMHSSTVCSGVTEITGLVMISLTSSCLWERRREAAPEAFLLIQLSTAGKCQNENLALCIGLSA